MIKDLGIQFNFFRATMKEIQNSFLKGRMVNAFLKG